MLAKQGVKLDVRVFNDYIQPNTQVAEYPAMPMAMRMSPAPRRTSA